MKQFDVCENRFARARARAPFLLILQNDALSDVPTRLVAPLIVASQIQPVERLNPEFAVRGQRYCLAILEMASFRRGLLGNTVANLDSERDKIIAALDLVFTGF